MSEPIELIRGTLATFEQTGMSAIQIARMELLNKYADFAAKEFINDCAYDRKTLVSVDAEPDLTIKLVRLEQLAQWIVCGHPLLSLQNEM